MKFINYTLQAGDTVKECKDFRRVYNDQGLEIYFENSDNYWGKYTYNEQGQVLYFEDSDEEWYKQEFNDQGKLVYYEDSYGFIDDKRKEDK